ncbi:MAG: Flp pilus assembly protein CpaB [Alphaproteobacteria bacterium GM7ARS4]|nr:Flp pilus assembly protein CpaB [Alphaproteobacteria bacterium GM7ARS4]
MALNKKQKKLALVVVGGLAFILLVIRPFSSDEEPVEETVSVEELVGDEDIFVPIETENVLVIPVPLKRGTVIGVNSLTLEAVPKDDMRDDYLRDADYTVEDLIGSVVLENLAAGSFLRREQVHIPSEDGSPLKAFMAYGMSAITVPVESYASVSDSIAPDDRVDVIVTFLGGGGGGQGAGTSLPSSRTLLRDIRVLAIGGVSIIDNAVSSGEQASPSTGGQFTATLEVTPRQAEELSVSSRLGSINFVLHKEKVDKQEAQRGTHGNTEALGEEIVPYLPSVSRGGRGE